MILFFALSMLGFAVFAEAAFAEVPNAKYDLDPKWRERAQWYFQRGNFLESARIHEKLIRKHPKNYWPYFCLGKCYQSMGRYNQAIWYFTQAKQYRPDWTYVDYKLAESYEKIGAYHWWHGRISQAIETFKKGVEAYPAYWKNHFWMGRLLFYQGQYAQAIGWMEQARDCNPLHYGPHTYLGLAYFKVGKLGLARKALEAAVRLSPARASARFNLGLVYARLGLWSKAWSEFHLAVTMGASKEAFKPRTA